MKGVYIHIPFCIKKCKYCDFNSFSACDEIKEEYLKALFDEMEEYKGEKVDTIFIGGGTPTVLTSNQIERLLSKINDTFKMSANTEFTVEANPKTVDEEKLLVMKKGGVNRLSIGVQSFIDEELLLIGRIHTSQDAINTIELAKKTGFDNINIDIMTAIPNQTKESLTKTIETAISQNPTHISCYSLILEEDTVLYDEVNSGKITLPKEDTERDLYELANKVLKENGYEQYEISNYAKDGFFSEHNMKYWRMEEYIGLGLSAHSYVNGTRFSNTDDIEKYLARKYRNPEIQVLSENDKMSEFMFLGLRTIDGVSKTDFLKMFGKSMFDVFDKPINKFKKLGFLIEDGDKIRLSHDAISVSNQIMCEFII